MTTPYERFLAKGKNKKVKTDKELDQEKKDDSMKSYFGDVFGGSSNREKVDTAIDERKKKKELDRSKYKEGGVVKKKYSKLKKYLGK